MTEKLDQVQLFDGLTESQLHSVEAVSEEIEFYNRERLFKDGDDAEYLWFVREGRVDLRFDLPSRDTSNECTISTVIKHGTLGWSALVKPHIYRLSAYCEADYVALSRIHRSKLSGLMQDNPEIGFHIMANLAQVIAVRFHDMQEEVATQIGHNVMDQW